MTYRRVLLYFTTGTGNAFRAATWVAESATAAGCEARIVRIEDAIPARELDPGPRAIEMRGADPHPALRELHAVHGTNQGRRSLWKSTAFATCRR